MVKRSLLVSHPRQVVRNFTDLSLRDDRSKLSAEDLSGEIRGAPRRSRAPKSTPANSSLRQPTSWPHRLINWPLRLIQSIRSECVRSVCTARLPIDGSSMTLVGGHRCYLPLVDAMPPPNVAVSTASKAPKILPHSSNHGIAFASQLRSLQRANGGQSSIFFDPQTRQWFGSMS
jgi:hypothetical protein